MIPQEVIDRLTNKISKSVDRVISSMERKDIQTEPNVTDRLLANIERDFEASGEMDINRNIKLRARTLKDRGPNASEKIYGADLATLLDIDLDDYKLQKGFLAQSKWESAATFLGRASVDTNVMDGMHSYLTPFPLQRPNINVETSGVITFAMNRQDYNRMRLQSKDMLGITSDSFIFIYTSNDVYVVPATSVVAGSEYKKQQRYYCKNFKLFMTDYLKSFIGDITLKGVSDEDFQEILDKKQAKSVLLFQVGNNIQQSV